MITKFSTPLCLIIGLLCATSCCKKSFEDIYFNANNIVVKNTYQFRDIGDGVTVNQQDYRIKCVLSDNVKQAINEFNNAKASLDYCEDNFIGLKKDISELTFLCTQDIWNTPAGSPLESNNIRFYENKFPEDSQNNRLTVQEWLSYVNNEDQLITFEWFIEMTEPITSAEYLKFQLRFELVDGSQYLAETPLVKFD